MLSCGWYMSESLRSLGLEIVEMRRPSGPCISTVSVDVGCAVIGGGWGGGVGGVGGGGPLVLCVGGGGGPPFLFSLLVAVC